MLPEANRGYGAATKNENEFASVFHGSCFLNMNQK